MQNNIKLAFILTILSGMSTMLGTFLIFKKKKKNNILAPTISFAAGVMISVSICDLIPESINYFSHNYQTIALAIICLIFVTLGIIISMLIDNILQKTSIKSNKLYKIGIMSMISLILHNIPEGIITFLTTNTNIKIGLSLSLAIAIHNIPEGISISVPIYYSTKSKIKAIGYTLISAISEPLGAVLAYFFISKYLNYQLMGILLSVTAGIMLQISFYELLPMAFKYPHKFKTIISFLLGISIMFLKFFI